MARVVQSWLGSPCWVKSVGPMNFGIGTTGTSMFYIIILKKYYYYDNVFIEYYMILYIYIYISVCVCVFFDVFLWGGDVCSF